MTTAATTPDQSAPAPQPKLPERTSYAVSGGRKTLISFIFLILLPFFASLGPMLYMRVSHGLYADAAGLVVLGIAFTALMFLLCINLMFSLRARVQLGEKAVRLTLPSGRGPTPMLRYVSTELPYADIAKVETRREIYGGAIAPVLLRGARIVKKDGVVVKLGYDAEENEDQAFPYVEIAHQIAHRAGLAVTDVGSVRRKVAAKMMGIAATSGDAQPEPKIEEAEIAALNGAHSRFVMILVGLLMALVATGIAMDVINPPSSSSAVLEGVEKPKKPR